MNSVGGTGGMLQANRTGTLSSGKTPKFSGDKIPRGYKAGALQQYTPEQLQLLQKAVAIRIVASGGVCSLQDVQKLNDMNVYGVIIGKALYEKTIDLEEALQVTKIC